MNGQSEQDMLQSLLNIATPLAFVVGGIVATILAYKAIRTGYQAANGNNQDVDLGTILIVGSFTKNLIPPLTVLYALAIGFIAFQLAGYNFDSLTFYLNLAKYSVGAAGLFFSPIVFYQFCKCIGWYVGRLCLR